MFRISFFIGVLLISLSVTYAWWVKVRIIRLREDIYDKRDWLFDTAARLDSFSDPAYKAARIHLNSIAGIAKFLSVQVVAFLSTQGQLKDAPRIKSDNPELQAAINDVFRWSAERIARYLLKETLSGWVIYGLLSGFNPEMKLNTLAEIAVERFIRSQAAIEMYNVDEHRYRNKAKSLAYLKLAIHKKV